MGWAELLPLSRSPSIGATSVRLELMGLFNESVVQPSHGPAVLRLDRIAEETTGSSDEESR